MALIDNHDPLMASFSQYYPKEGLKYSTFDFLEYNPKIPGDGKMTVFFYCNWIYHILIGGFYVAAIAKLVLILFFLDFPKTGKQISQKQYKIGQATALLGFSSCFFIYQAYLIFFLNFTNLFIWELFPDWEFIDTYDCENEVDSYFMFIYVIFCQSSIFIILALNKIQLSKSKVVSVTSHQTTMQNDRKTVKNKIKIKSLKGQKQNQIANLSDHIYVKDHLDQNEVSKDQIQIEEIDLNSSSKNLVKILRDNTGDFMHKDSKEKVSFQKSDSIGYKSSLSEDTDKSQENKYNTPITQTELNKKGKRAIANFQDEVDVYSIMYLFYFSKTLQSLSKCNKILLIIFCLLVWGGQLVLLFYLMTKSPDINFGIDYRETQNNLVIRTISCFFVAIFIIKEILRPINRLIIGCIIHRDTYHKIQEFIQEEKQRKKQDEQQSRLVPYNEHHYHFNRQKSDINTFDKTSQKLLKKLPAYSNLLMHAATIAPISLQLNLLNLTLMLSIKLIFAVDNSENNIGILKDFTAIIIISEIDSKAIEFLFAFSKHVYSVDIKKKISREIELFNRYDISDDDWDPKFKIHVKFFCLASFLLPVIYQTIWFLGIKMYPLFY
eukprot:403342361